MVSANEGLTRRHEFAKASGATILGGQQLPETARQENSFASTIDPM
jgi:hypothetical protein